MISAVFFDLDDTLFDYRGFMSACEDRLCREAGSVAGVSRKTCLVSYRNLKRRMYRARPLDPAIFDWAERIASLLSAIGVRPEPDIVDRIFEDFWNHFLSTIEPYPDAAPVLEWLRTTGRRRAVISNGIRAQQSKKVEMLGLAGLLDAQYYSEDVGKNKPSTVIFRHALRDIGCLPEESLMVGDLCYVDVKGAKDSGMRTCWLRIGAYSRLSPKNVGEQPDFVIRRLADLKQAIGKS